jgi:hypothetical protein
MVIGRPSTAKITIDGLPQGDVTLLGHNALLKREGDVVTLPNRPDDTPVYTLRIQ